MADAPISLPAVESTPATYTLGDAAEFILKAVYAEFDGSGAGAAWLPAVVIRSDAGRVIARAVDPAVSVAAGASADVSFFPGVKHAAAAAATGAAPDTVRLRGVNMVVPSVPGGFSGEITWNNATKVETGTGIWTYTLDGSGNVVEVLASAPGLYEMFFACTFDAPSASVTESLTANVFGTIPLADKFSVTVEEKTPNIYGAATGLLTSFASGTAQFSTQVDFDNNASGFVRPEEWWLKHWTI